MARFSAMTSKSFCASLASKGALSNEVLVILCGLFGWGGFGFMDLNLRVHIQIFCLDGLKSLGFGFRLNLSRIKGPNPWISNHFLR